MYSFSVGSVPSQEQLQDVIPYNRDIFRVSSYDIMDNRRPDLVKAIRGGKGRFPFDQIFWFKIPGIPCDEWNSIFRFVGLTRPRFQVSRENTKGRLFYLCILALGLLEDAEVEINDVLGESDNITFIVGI